MEHEVYMRHAIELAKQCIPDGDVPVGCVIVSPDGTIIGEGRNRREADGSATAHAEVEAINMACKTLGTWRLSGCTLYVTLEPCPMCAGAIINARIPRIVCGAKDAKAGSCGSVCNLFAMEYNHHPAIEFGLCEAESSALLSDFFQSLRLTLRDRPKWKKPE